MAVITGYGDVHNDGHIQYHWEGLGNGDQGVGVSLATFAETSVQVSGTFGSGGDMNLEGSNDGGTTWFVLNDPQGTALAITDTGVYKVQEYAELVRPNVIAGDGTTNLDIHLISRKPV